jgi:hypothetical protein
MPNAAVFLGPSLPRAEAEAILPDAAYFPPAKRGDIAGSGADIIVLIDGVFFQDEAVGHREILAALRNGVKVFGASSMGALRAAEMDTLGMTGVGEIYRWYKEGIVTADDEVGLVYDPETGIALSEPMVNIRATLAAAVQDRIITAEEEQQLLSACRDMYYPDRTCRRVIQKADIAGETKDRLSVWVKTHAVDQKRLDAVLCLETVGRIR